MKVLQLTTHINIGGIANYILNLSSELKGKGVDVLVASSGGNLENEFKARSIPLKFLNINTKFELGPKVMGSAMALKKIIKEEKIDIIHAHTRVSQSVAFFASGFADVPYVTTCHGYFKVRARKIFDTWGKKVIAISDAVSAHLKDDLGVDGGRVRVIYSGVDAGKFARNYSEAEKNGLKMRLGIKNGPVIGSIGRLSGVKGHRYLVQAMAEIAAHKKDAQCVIVGDGDEKMALENLAKALNVKDRIVFVPSDPDTAKLLSVMDIFVFPSVKEGLGIALLEAMAAGKASVASDIGGINDILKGADCGIMTPVGDVKAIRNAVIKLIDEPALRAGMGERARNLVREKFSLDAMGDKVIQLYKEVISEKG